MAVDFPLGSLISRIGGILGPDVARRVGGAAAAEPVAAAAGFAALLTAIVAALPLPAALKAVLLPLITLVVTASARTAVTPVTKPMPTRAGVS